MIILLLWHYHSNHIHWANSIILSNQGTDQGIWGRKTLFLVNLITSRFKSIKLFKTYDKFSFILFKTFFIAYCWVEGLKNRDWKKIVCKSDLGRILAFASPSNSTAKRFDILIAIFDGPPALDPACNHTARMNYFCQVCCK